MGPAFNIVSLVIISIMHVIGVVNSAFIVAVNLMDWAKGQKLSTCDLILVTVGVFSISCQLTLVGHSYFSAKWWDVYTPGYKITILYLFLIWTGSSSYWLTTCLCVFYCVKIADFNHDFFIWMKLRISKVIPWLILGSVVGSLALSVPTFWDFYRHSHQNSTTNPVLNSTNTDAWLSFTVPDLIASNIGFCLPLLLNTISIILILTSLVRHTRRMKENVSAFCQPRLQSHFAAARIMGLLLIVYFLVILNECSFLLFSGQWWAIAAGMIDTAQIPVQSTVLILGNSKLKQALSKIISPCRK